jgi:predicted DNA-binding transcriptional regulator AlpA
MRRGRREAELMTALQERVQQVSPAPALVVDVYGAMQMLRLGRCSVLALADRGDLPRLRFGRAVRFAVSDVEALVERRRSASQGDDGLAAPRRTGPGCSGSRRLTRRS